MKTIVTTVSAMLVAFAIQAQEPSKKAAAPIKKAANEVKSKVEKRDMPAAEKAAAKVEKSVETPSGVDTPPVNDGKPKEQAKPTDPVSAPKVENPKL